MLMCHIIFLIIFLTITQHTHIMLGPFRQLMMHNIDMGSFTPYPLFIHPS